ncbi:MAG: DNA polymerase III subunit alpha [Deltaproteobacteria bacterium]|nr:DNA polymerase III subunit alpha [Deltaproteobacteria bacterium]
MAEFVHLHVHTEYSLLDGAIRCRALADHAKGLGMKSVALTDHANMFGAITHYTACHAAEVQPLLGCEVNVLREDPTGQVAGAARGDGGLLDHLVLLAENAQGYRNLLSIVSSGHLDPASPAAPSVRLQTIADASEGLVALTGCMGGVLAQQVLEYGEARGRETLERLRGIVPEGALYVELQDHGLPEQPVLNGLLTQLAGDLGLPVVGTNDCHFVDRSDGEAQLYLTCIANGRAYADAREGHHGSYEMYLKSPEQMVQLFRHTPEAVASTLEIAERCAGLKLELGTPMLPKFPVPDGHDAATYLREVTYEGLEARFDEMRAAGKTIDDAVFRERLEMELGVIITMDFPGYFLIVWDFMRHAREKSIPVGPGRGSGAGSLVAYALRITDLDPLEHQLLFERFLNPERVSMPDFDIDFCMDRRDEVISYVAQRYGVDSVGQIATFHELKARSVIKDVARAMGMPAPEAQRIANLIPQKAPGQMYTIGEALEIEPKLPAAAESDPTIAELLAQAQRLEGLTRHAGMHAAGVVISDGPLWDYVPCFKTGDQVVTQFAKDEVEAAGLVKFDFLGLKTLTVIDIAQRLIRQRPAGEAGPAGEGEEAAAPPFDVKNVSLDDRKTYALLQSGETTGVFQLESSGMQQLFKDLRPTIFDDVVAAVALYRPGPLGTGMVADFIACKHGRKAIAKMHDLVDEILEPTYGVIVYQEQVMQIAQRLAGYTLGGADLLRRAMGKKKVEAMAKQKGIFVEGALSNGVTREDAEHIFGLLEFFAGYGFNRSHSAAYALLTYQTAFLKAHYPVEFLCALLTADRDKTDKVVRIIAEGRAWGVDILPPAVNESRVDFTVIYGGTAGTETAEQAPPRRGKALFDDPLEPKIRFGLGAVRGVGDSALEALLEAREAGPFEDLFDLAQRVDVRRLNRGVLEALVQCGALDATLEPLGVNRARAFASIDRVLERGRSASRDRECGQTNLFGLLKPTEGEQSSAAEYVDHEPWDFGETLKREKQALGFFVSGHPLDRYGMELGRFDVTEARQLSGMDPWARVRVAGTVEGYRERVFRTGGKVAFFVLEDLTGGIEVKARERQLTHCGELLVSGEPVLLSGKLQFPMSDDGDDGAGPGTREPTILLDEAVSLSEAIRAEARRMVIRLPGVSTTRDQLEKLEKVLRGSRGACPVQLVIVTEDGAEAVLALRSDLRVDPNDVMFASLERLFGANVAELR